MDVNYIRGNRVLILITLLLGVSWVSCRKAGDWITVEVTNESKEAVCNRMVELSLADLYQKCTDGRSFRVFDAAGKEIPSQQTYDSLLIFQVSLPAGRTARYRIESCDLPLDYASKVGGRIYPERDDDVAWENELVGFRAYGPALQRRGERGFGYDLFFKYPDKGLVLERLYALATDPANWKKVDSLRVIDFKLAEAFADSFSYHVDHGWGMDCFQVGPTLGAGVAAPIVGDSLAFPWCYNQAEILDQGPLRFTVRLDFAARPIGNQEAVVEHRLISLDAGSQFNKTQVWYDRQTDSIRLATGFPLREEIPCCAEEPLMNLIAYSHPTQREEYGRALLGVVVPDCQAEVVRKYGHLLLVRTLLPGEKHTYFWGFQWQKQPEDSLLPWVSEMEAEIDGMMHSLNIRIND